MYTWPILLPEAALPPGTYLSATSVQLNLYEPASTISMSDSNGAHLEPPRTEVSMHARREAVTLYSTHP